MQTTAFQWVIDPATGDYVMQNGAPVLSADLTYPAYYRCKIPRKKWLYAPDSNYGSDFATQYKQISSNTSVLEAIATRAMQPIIDDGRAAAISVTTLQRSRTGTQLQTDITPVVGEVQTIQFDPIGLG